MSAGVVPLKFLFDRPLRPGSRWIAALDRNQDASAVDIRVLGSNVAMDHRVSVEAEQLIGDTAAEVLGDQDRELGDALRGYFRQYCVRPSREVTFLSHTVHVPGSTQLVHVSSLTSLLRRVSRESANLLRLRDYFATSFGSSRYVPPSARDWTDQAVGVIANLLNGLGDDRMNAAVEQFHALLGNRVPHWWAAPEREVNGALRDARQLLSALGVGHVRNEDWLLVYRYTAATAGLLYQPTIVEADGYPFHFPNPPSLRSGLTMPLLSGGVPVTEYIHHPLDPIHAGQSVHRRLLQVRGMPEDAEVFGALADQRLSHKRSLLKAYKRNQTDESWLHRHGNGV